MAKEQAWCVLCHMEEKKERIVNRLIKRRIPADMWDYFLEIRVTWTSDLQSHLKNGTP